MMPREDFVRIASLDDATTAASRRCASRAALSIALSSARDTSTRAPRLIAAIRTRAPDSVREVPSRRRSAGARASMPSCLEVRALTRRHIEHWHAGYERTRTAGKVLMVLGAILHYAQRRELITTNPVDGTSAATRSTFGKGTTSWASTSAMTKQPSGARPRRSSRRTRSTCTTTRRTTSRTSEPVLRERWEVAMAILDEGTAGLVVVAVSD